MDGKALVRALSIHTKKFHIIRGWLALEQKMVLGEMAINFRSQEGNLFGSACMDKLPGLPMEFWYVEALKTLGNKADKLIYLKTEFNSKGRQRSCKKIGGNKQRKTG